MKSIRGRTGVVISLHPGVNRILVRPEGWQWPLFFLPEHLAPIHDGLGRDKHLD